MANNDQGDRVACVGKGRHAEKKAGAPLLKARSALHPHGARVGVALELELAKPFRSPQVCLSRSCAATVAMQIAACSRHRIRQHAIRTAEIVERDEGDEMGAATTSPVSRQDEGKDCRQGASAANLRKLAGWINPFIQGQARFTVAETRQRWPATACEKFQVRALHPLHLGEGI